MIIAVDIDGVLCTDLHEKFRDAKKIQENVDILNWLYDQGHHIMIYTARGRKEKDKDAKKDSIKQLDEWGVKYNEFRIDKPFFDIVVEDKSFQSLHALKKAIEKIGGG